MNITTYCNKTTRWPSHDDDMQCRGNGIAMPRHRRNNEDTQACETAYASHGAGSTAARACAGLGTGPRATLAQSPLAIGLTRLALCKVAIVASCLTDCVD